MGLAHKFPALAFVSDSICPLEDFMSTVYGEVLPDLAIQTLHSFLI